ncbi:MerR family transcriptional regulator [Paludibacteraceae bacterium OttesenSCG-928-F17]|nr:MerR family transcriptional regulator [Paludibacteraceae bacterium OttesenSCG-928-F17]
MEKLYYSIAEVAKMFNVNQSLLRFWEKEFKQLSPRRNEKGTRFYTKQDILIIKQIEYLVNEQKLTLDGARKKLSQKKELVDKHFEISERLKFVRNELKDIAKHLPSE